MARTLTVNKGGGGNYGEGWKTLTISKATYGDYNDSKYIDVWFEGYPDNFNARIYAKVNNGEEWAIGQVFRFANAGITGCLEGSDGNIVIKMDDDPAQLTGKQVNVYMYKEGKYSRILKQFAPTPFTNDAETFSDDDVTYWKNRAEQYFTKHVQPKLNGTDQEYDKAGHSEMNHATEPTSSYETNSEEVPF